MYLCRRKPQTDAPAEVEHSEGDGKKNTFAGWREYGLGLPRFRPNDYVNVATFIYIGESCKPLNTEQRLIPYVCSRFFVCEDGEPFCLIIHFKNIEVMNYLAIIDKSAQEMQRNYFENELWYDKHNEFDKLGMDNVSGNFGTYELEYYLEQGNRAKYVDELHRMFVFFYTIMWMAECKGYGFNAAARGFDVTSPYGLLWTKCERAIFAIATLCEIYKVANLGWAKEAIADARKTI